MRSELDELRERVEALEAREPAVFTSIAVAKAEAEVVRAAEAALDEGGFATYGLKLAEMFDRVRDLRAARAVREGQNEQGEATGCTQSASESGRTSSAGLASPASPPAFARETPPWTQEHRRAVRLIRDAMAEHAPYEDGWMDVCKTIRILAYLFVELPPSPPPETRTDEKPPRKCFVCDQSESDVFGDAPWLCADHIPEKPALPPAQPPKRATGMPNEYEIAAAILKASEHEMSGADNLRAARAVKALVSEHVARVTERAEEAESALKQWMRGGTSHAFCDNCGWRGPFRDDGQLAHDDMKQHHAICEKSETFRLKAECERLRAEVKTERAEKNTREHEHWQVMKRVMDAISAELKALGHPESGGKIEDLAIAGLRAEKARADAAERKLEEAEKWRVSVKDVTAMDLWRLAQKKYFSLDRWPGEFERLDANTRTFWGQVEQVMHDYAVLSNLEGKHT